MTAWQGLSTPNPLAPTARHSIVSEIQGLPDLREFPPSELFDTSKSTLNSDDGAETSTDIDVAELAIPFSGSQISDGRMTATSKQSNRMKLFGNLTGRVCTSGLDVRVARHRLLSTWCGLTPGATPLDASCGALTEFISPIRYLRRMLIKPEISDDTSLKKCDLTGLRGGLDGAGTSKVRLIEWKSFFEGNQPAMRLFAGAGQAASVTG